MTEEKLTLKEKIARLKAEQEANKGKVQPESKTPEALPGEDIKNKLLALGLQKQVNPPATESPVKGWTAPTPQPVSAESTEEFKEQTGVEVTGTVCPTCGKIFKVLARHKCTGREPVAEITTEENAAVTTAETPIEAKTVKEIYKHQYILLIDCVLHSPGEECIDARRIISPVIEGVEKRLSVSHWKLIEYAQGIAIIEREFQAYWERKEYAGVIELDSRMLEYAAVVGTFKRFASKVIQGIR